MNGAYNGWAGDEDYIQAQVEMGKELEGWLPWSGKDTSSFLSMLQGSGSLSTKYKLSSGIASFDHPGKK